MIIIIYSVCPIFTNPPDWRKALSNGVRNHLFKLKTSKISQGGDLPPPAPPPRSRSGLRPDRRGLKLWGKKMIPRRGGGGKKMIEMHNIYPWIWMFSPSLLLENHITHDILFSYPYELYRCASAAGRPRWSKIRTAHTGTWDPSRGP